MTLGISKWIPTTAVVIFESLLPLLASLMLLRLCVSMSGKSERAKERERGGALDYG